MRCAIRRSCWTEYVCFFDVLDWYYTARSMDDGVGKGWYGLLVDHFMWFMNGILS